MAFFLQNFLLSLEFIMICILSEKIIMRLIWAIS